MFIDFKSSTFFWFIIFLQLYSKYSNSSYDRAYPVKHPVKKASIITVELLLHQCITCNCEEAIVIRRIVHFYVEYQVVDVNRDNNQSNEKWNAGVHEIHYFECKTGSSAMIFEEPTNTEERILELCETNEVNDIILLRNFEEIVKYCRDCVAVMNLQKPRFVWKIWISYLS